MRQGESPFSLEHAALSPARGVPPGAAVLSDRQRLAVLLQASSLLCHLQLTKRCLEGGWEDSRISNDGRLSGLRTTTGSADLWPQAQLTELATLLFRADQHIAGRGEARRAMRALLKMWEQQLTPLSADEAVKQLLDHASFLWQSTFSTARSTLAAVHWSHGDERLWVAGPEWFRKPLLKRCGSLAELEQCLASDTARSLWRGNQRCPHKMESEGRWRAAVAAWKGRERDSPTSRIACARALFAVGRFKEAIEEIRGLRRQEASVIRLHCLQRLGELRKARRILGRLESVTLGEDVLSETAAVAVRVYGNLGEPQVARAWARRARQEALTEQVRLRAALTSFAAAWDCGDVAEMSRWLDKAKPARDIERLAWRWRKARALESISRGDGSAAVEALSRALNSARRRLSPLEAGDLWNEMALARSLNGDLRGAERALLHTLSLHREVEGPRRTTLALFNLAEVRLRRGRLTGVAEILELSSRENRQAGNWRGIVHDTELWARFDLVRGRPSSAADRLAKARSEFKSRGVSWRSAQLAALRARAFGWLGRQQEAAAELAAVSEEALSEFEPEERPALWALAGDRERAFAGIEAGDPAASVWRAVLDGRAPTDDEWKQLAFDDEYRLARLVLDIGFVADECVPLWLARRARGVFQRLGARVLAERVESGSAGSWEAVAAYLEEGVAGAGGVARLFANGGYGEARLVRRREGIDEILVDGAGGQSEISENIGSTELVLSSSWIDPALRVMFRLVLRDLEHDLEDTEPTASGDTVRFGMIGESKALGEAMERLAQLAPEEVPLLLLGETGTGKELAARRGHMMSPRASGPFVPINCAAVSEDLLMSDLFGHVRGAYTGAVRDRIGVFEAARGGTVFLDEIGDLPLRAQGFLLRVLQENEVRRVGESLSRSTDVRVITATHRDLDAMVRDGDFRADLYYRLRVARIELPPLRHRDGDVVLLAEHFIRRMRPSRTPRISKAARGALLGHQWPGNVRELENVLSVAVAMVTEGSLQPEHLELPCRGGEPDRGYHEEVLNFRRRLVRNALDGSSGNRAEAARALGLTRQALSYLVRKLEIDL